MDSSISVEETNKLRISLGLKPLGEDKGAEDETTKAEDNYSKIKEEQKKSAEAQKILQSIEKSKNRLNLTKKISGKTLGDEDENEASAADWVKKNRSKIHGAAKLIKKGTKASSNSSKSTTKVDSGSMDINVGHDLGDFDEGSEVFLTLKDTNVLDEGEDELVSLQLQEREKLKVNLDNKKKRSHYNPYDDEEEVFGVGNYNNKKNILAHYDEEIDGPINKKKGFKISAYSGDNISSELTEVPSNRPSGTAISLDFNSMNQVKDYYTKEEAESLFKKPKIKKKKNKRKPLLDDQPPLVSEQASVPDPTPIVSSIPETNFVDDDDLQQALARARRVATRRTANFSEEKIVGQLQTKSDSDSDTATDVMTISDTSEFVQNLTTASALQTEKMLRSQQKLEKVNKSTEETAEPIANAVQEVEENPLDSHLDDNIEEEGIDGLVEDEKPIGKGLASVLEVLMKKGLYTKPTDEQVKRDKLQSDHSKWIVEQRKKNVGKEKDRVADKHRDHKARQRGGHDRDDEYHRERSFAEEQLQRMANYRPDISIRHMDSSGNDLNPKEAFRLLSHKFHGKTSGMKKTEKRLMQIENAKRLASMTSSDTPLGTASALAKRQKAKGTAHIILDGHK